MFGLWISEYGYENWAELDSKIASLRTAGFPLSGAVLDLYWFGGIKANSTTSPMGRLNWDTTNFPDPEGKIARVWPDVDPAVDAARVLEAASEMAAARDPG